MTRELQREVFREGSNADAADFDFTVSLDGLLDADESSSMVSAMHGRGAARLEIKKEQPWHRQLAYLMAHGMSQKQVAEACGKSLAAVNLAFAQPWVQQQILDIIREERINDGAASLLKNASAAAAMTVITIAAGGPKVSTGTQLKASQIILDRVLGPAGHEKMSPNEGSVGSEGDLEEINNQILQLEEKMTTM